MITEAQWLGITIRSESDQPHEWWAVGWVIRNRVEHPTYYPNSYFEVVTQPRAFSYFNKLQSLRAHPDELYTAARRGYAGDARGWSANDLVEAEACASDILTAHRWHAPFAPNTTLFWSPRSMTPPGSDPPWASEPGIHAFEIPGILPDRFKFALEIR